MLVRPRLAVAMWMYCLRTKLVASCAMDLLRKIVAACRHGTPVPLALVTDHCHGQAQQDRSALPMPAVAGYLPTTGAGAGYGDSPAALRCEVQVRARARAVLDATASGAGWTSPDGNSQQPPVGPTPE